MPGQGPQIRVNQRYQFEDFRQLTSTLFHETLHQDPTNSSKEQLTAAALDTLVQAQTYPTDPALAASRTELTRRLNTKLMARINSGPGPRLGLFTANGPNLYPGGTPLPYFAAAFPPGGPDTPGNTTLRTTLRLIANPGTTPPPGADFNDTTLQFIDQKPRTHLHRGPAHRPQPAPVRPGSDLVKPSRARLTACRGQGAFLPFIRQPAVGPTLPWHRPQHAAVGGTDEGFCPPRREPAFAAQSCTRTLHPNGPPHAAMSDPRSYTGGMKRSASQRLAVAVVLSAVAALGPPGSSAAVMGQPSPMPGDIVEDLRDHTVPEATEGTKVPQSSGQPTMQAVAAYLNSVVQDADVVWTAFFTAAGLQEPLVSVVVVTPEQPPITSNCLNPDQQPFVIAHDTPNAFYCPNDQYFPGHAGTIYLPVTTMQKMWTGNVFERRSQRAGDFAAAILTAHEFGHHVVDEWGTQLSRRDGVTYPQPGAKWKELIADCLAGTWTAHAYYSGYLQDGDFDEAVTALEAVGDYRFFAPDHHGTPQERREALLTGYHGIPNRYPPGAPAACVEKYWKLQG
ncbi:neutral zinc metallopeptidase [Streptomyces sp. NPDC127106]|uniref:neutral zinc metallopeptidase n=1 Tax=Streptomyces sp. NPDC127106 TaxID=3345360 RepID=UPI003626B8F8